MAKPVAAMGKILANTKARMMFIIFGIVGILIIGAVVIHMMRGPGMIAGAAQVASIPAGIQSVPGVNQENDQYLQILLQSNQQAAKTAMQNGQTEIPTLIATPATAMSTNFNAQGVAASGQQCCCQQGGGQQANDAGGVISTLENAGKISPILAGQLRALQAEGLTPTQYEQQLRALVAQGKLTPAEAQQLLDAYKAQAAGSAAPLVSPDDLVNQLAQSGDITPATAAELKALDAQNLSPQDYLAKLNQLVKAGKLSSANAQKLAAAYAATHGESAAVVPPVTPDGVVDQLLGSGAISPATAQAIKALNGQGLSPAAYMNKLNDLVKSGQLTPAQARRLLQAYEQEAQYAHQASPAALVQQMESDGDITPDTANQLNALADKGLSPADYEAQLQKLVSQGKLTPAQANLLMQAYERQHAGKAAGVQAGGLAALQQAQEAQAAAQQEQALSQQQVQLQQAAESQLQQETGAAQSAIAGQASKLFDAWNMPTQRLTGQFIDKTEQEKAAEAAAAGQGAGTEKVVMPPVIKAGDVMFAVLDTAIDSDQVGPVMATIVSGKFKGAKLLGGLTVTSDKQAVILNFTKMSMPDWISTASINAVAIDPETARTALADNVDHHYLLRYGSMFASSFMQGIGQAIQQSGQTQVNNAGTNTTTFSKLNLGEKLLVGLGQVGQNMGSAAQQNFNTPPTVTVKSGQGVGILFQTDVQLPTVTEQQAAAAEPVTQTMAQNNALATVPNNSGSQESSTQ